MSEIHRLDHDTLPRGISFHIFLLIPWFGSVTYKNIYLPLIECRNVARQSIQAFFMVEWPTKNHQISGVPVCLQGTLKDSALQRAPPLSSFILLHLLLHLFPNYWSPFQEFLCVEPDCWLNWRSFLDKRWNAFEKPPPSGCPWCDWEPPQTDR